jgi:lipopolysaccharide export system ATP-binding protein
VSQRAIEDQGSQPEPAASLQAEDLWVDAGTRTVLRGLSITVTRGEVLGVLGPSGSGKSTLFRALAGESPLTRGCVRLFGEDVSGLPLFRRARKGLGYIPQEPSVFWDLSVTANLQAFAQLVRRDPPRTELRNSGATLLGEIAQLLEAVGLQDRRDVLARQLSAGERRRLEFARALTGAPTVLLCDEPFAGVDPLGAAGLGLLLAKLAERGVSVVLADHHVEEALAVCTRAVLLIDGAIAVSGSPSEFRAHKSVQGRYLGTYRPSSPPST